MDKVLSIEGEKKFKGDVDGFGFLFGFFVKYLEGRGIWLILVFYLVIIIVIFVVFVFLFYVML